MNANTNPTQSPAISQMASALMSQQFSSSSWAPPTPPRLPADHAIALFSIYGADQVNGLKSIHKKNTHAQGH